MDSKKFEKIRAIRHDYQRGVGIQALMDQYSYSYASIYNIIGDIVAKQKRDRNIQICTAARNGTTVCELMERTGLSRTGINYILDAEGIQAINDREKTPKSRKRAERNRQICVDAQTMTNKQLCEKYNISPSTVSNILRKHYSCFCEDAKTMTDTQLSEKYGMSASGVSAIIKKYHVTRSLHLQ